MKIFYSALFILFLPIAPVQAMDTTPKEISTSIFSLVLYDMHNRVTTLQEARDYLCCISLINKECYALTQNPHLIKDVIGALSRTLRHNRYCFYEHTVAGELKTPAAKNYGKLSEQLFSNDLSVEDVELLLKQGADPNYRSSNLRSRNTPLISHAYKPESIQIVECLLHHGADVNRWGNNNNYPFDAAVCSRSSEMVKLILQFKPKFPDCPIFTPFTSAIASGNTNQDIIEQLIQYTQQESKPNILIEGFRDALRNSHNRPQEFATIVQQFAPAGAQTPSIFIPTVRATLKFELSLDTLQTFCDQQNTHDNIQAALQLAHETQQRVSRVIAMLEGVRTTDI